MAGRAWRTQTAYEFTVQDISRGGSGWSGSWSCHTARRSPRGRPLAREMAGEELALEAAGGIEDSDPADPVLGTDAERVRAAITRAMSQDGVLVLMDLGSALMSAEFAIELLQDAPGPVRLSDAPLVEGTVAAAVAASGGATLDQVAAEARGSLAMKSAQLGEAATEEPAADDVGMRRSRRTRGPSWQFATRSDSTLAPLRASSRPRAVSMPTCASPSSATERRSAHQPDQSRRARARGSATRWW